VELGDLVANADELYRVAVAVVLWTPPGSPCIPVLGRRLELVVTDSTI